MIDGQVVIVGFGRIALTHLPIILALGVERRQIKIVEKDFFARQLARRFRFSVTSSLESIDWDRVDRVMILVPAFAKIRVLETIKRLAKRDIALFIEKPVTKLVYGYLQTKKLAVAHVGYVYLYDPLIESIVTNSVQQGLPTKIDVRISCNQQITLSRQATVPLLDDVGCHAVSVACYFTSRMNLDVLHVERRVLRYSGDTELAGELQFSCASAWGRETVEIIAAYCRDDTARERTEMEVRVTRDNVVLRNEYDDARVRPMAIERLKTPFYLRGEMFTKQMESFLSGTIDEHHAKAWWETERLLIEQANDYSRG